MTGKEVTLYTDGACKGNPGPRARVAFAGTVGIQSNLFTGHNLV